MASKQLSPRAAFEENARTYVEQVRNEGDVDLLADLMAGEISVMGEDLVLTPELHGESIRDIRAAFPDYHVAIEDLWFDEDASVGFINFTATGTFENELVFRPDLETELRFEPTGEAFEYGGVYIGVFEGDTVVEIGGYVDELSMFVDLGIVPELSELAA